MPNNMPVLKKDAALDRWMNRKTCWIAKQYAKGWRLGLVSGNDEPVYFRVWFRSKKDVEKALALGIVFVYLDDATEAEGV
jgi:hypothetical protein